MKQNSLIKRNISNGGNVTDHQGYWNGWGQKKEDVDTRAFFYPPNKQPVLSDYIKKEDVFPNTNFISERGLYLPSGLAITKKQIQKVTSTVKSIYRKTRRG